jgi:hypothetical protein
MSRRVTTVLARIARPVARPVAGALRRHPLVVPAVLFVLVLALGLSDVGRSGVDGGRGAEANAGLAGAQTLPTQRGDGGTGGSEPPDGSGSGSGAAGGATSAGVPTGGPGQLPRGGTLLFPRYRLVGYSGGPQSAAFGRLGIGDLDARVDEIERRGAAYAAGREPLPVLELIAVIAQARPGADGTYRLRTGDAVIREYLAAARRHRALLLLNIQPGRADFLAEVKALEPWLVQPDVGVALDPEWAVGPREVPGRVYGRTSGRELARVAAYLQSLVREHGLPQKAMVVHQLAPRIVTDFQAVGRHPDVAVILSVDGIGARADKVATWRRLVADLPPAVHAGFKLFFEEDTESGALMTPQQVLALRPQPEYVLYE